MIGYMKELNELTGHNSTPPASGGSYTLDGVQACATHESVMAAVMTTAEPNAAYCFDRNDAESAEIQYSDTQQTDQRSFWGHSDQFFQYGSPCPCHKNFQL